MNTALFDYDSSPEPRDEGERLQDLIEAREADAEQLEDMSELAAHDVADLARMVTELLAHQQNPHKCVELLDRAPAVVMNVTEAFSWLAGWTEDDQAATDRHAETFPARVRAQLPTGLRPFLQLGQAGLAELGNAHLADVLSLIAELLGLAAALTGAPYRHPEAGTPAAQIRAGLSRMREELHTVTTLAATGQTVLAGGGAR